MELYNSHRVKALIPPEQKKLNEIFVVESFYAAMYLHQEGYPNTVAIMGRFLSPEQLKLLESIASHATFFLDGDMAGKKAIENLENTLKKDSSDMTYKIIRYPENCQRNKPNQFTAEELKQILGKKYKQA